MNPTSYVVLSAILFTIGTVGFMIRRNSIVAFMCVELMLNATNLALVTFSRMHGALDGQVAGTRRDRLRASMATVASYEGELFGWLDED